MSNKATRRETIHEVVRDHIDYREQTLKMAKSDIIRTYRASALGWSWAVIKPVITIFIYWFAMSIGLRAGKNIGNYPYILWLVDGLVPWFYISDMFNRGTDCMRKYRYLITKMHYPVSTIPTFVSMANMAVNLILIVVVMLMHPLMQWMNPEYECMPNIYWLQLPLYLLFSFIMFTAWSLFAGPISAISQDFSNLVKSLVFGLLWGSGIFFNVETIKSETVQLILKANPITYIVTGIRRSFMGDSWFFEHPKALAVFLVEMIIMIILAFWSYRRLRKEIPDVL